MPRAIDPPVIHRSYPPIERTPIHDTSLSVPRAEQTMVEVEKLTKAEPVAKPTRKRARKAPKGQG